METSKWKKGDEMVDGGERRTFTFLAENKDEKEIWLYQIRFVDFFLPRSLLFSSVIPPARVCCRLFFR